MANPFVHVELMSTDLGKAKEFYQTLKWPVCPGRFSPSNL